MSYRYVPVAPFPTPWATDESYTSGPDIGTPTKETPSSGMIAQGFVGDQQVSAQAMNFVLAGMGGVGPLIHAVFRAWRPYLVQAEASDADTYQIGGYQDSFDVVTNSTHVIASFRTSLNGLSGLAKPMLLAIRNLTTTEASIYLSSDGSHWAQAIGSLAANADVAGTHVFDILGDDFSGQDNVYVVSDKDRSIYRWMGALAGAADEIAAVAPANHGFSCIGCDNVGTLLAGVSQTASTAARIFRSTDGGATWTQATTPAGWDTIPIHSFCATNPVQADLAAGDVVLATGAIDGEILRSVNQGLTWTAVTLPAALASRVSWDAYQLAWSPVWQKFMIMNKDLDCATSTDGLTWAVLPGSGGQTTAINPAQADRGRLLTAVGPAFVLAANIIGGEGYNRHGVFYSFDCGLSWHFVDFGAVEADNVQQLFGIVEWGGALAAYAPGKVFVSPSVWLAPVDLDFS